MISCWCWWEGNGAANVILYNPLKSPKQNKSIVGKNFIDLNLKYKLMFLLDLKRQFLFYYHYMLDGSFVFRSATAAELQLQKTKDTKTAFYCRAELFKPFILSRRIKYVYIFII